MLYFKRLFIFLLFGVAALYALPNFFPLRPALEFTSRTAQEKADYGEIANLLRDKGISFLAVQQIDKKVRVYFSDHQEQAKARGVLGELFSVNYRIAVLRERLLPEFLVQIGAKPLNLGLDLQGGVEFVLEVNTTWAIERYLDGVLSGVLEEASKKNIAFSQAEVAQVSGSESYGEIQFTLKENKDVEVVRDILLRQFPQQTIKNQDLSVVVVFAKSQLGQFVNQVIEQNIVTLRARANAIGVSEPAVFRQGVERIVVQLPGVQDPTEAKQIFGTTANLEFRLEAKNENPLLGKKFPAYDENEKWEAWLERKMITTGEHITQATASRSQQTNAPEVSITLDSAGGASMLQATSPNVGRKMAAVLYENQADVEYYQEDGVYKSRPTSKEKMGIVSLAVIQSAFASNFRITGIGNYDDARRLALLLRSGSLRAPISIVDEKTIGATLGEKNITMGLYSTLAGFLLVIIFMIWRYKVFGAISVVALFYNVVLLLTALSMLGATLTLPGIAGIVLTVGMAVDANVIINSRIKEFLRMDYLPYQALQTGYKEAFRTIFDSNVTTILVVMVLFFIGTGSVKGFSITLASGLTISMFTSVYVSHIIADWLYPINKNKQLRI